VKTRDRLRERDAAAIAAASSFTVNWFLGSGRWDRAEGLATLAAARAVRDERGRDRYGRIGGIYAVTPNGMTIFVE